MIPDDPEKKALTLNGLGFAYGSQWVIRNATFSVREREFVSIVGPNGSGKSTLVKLALGLLNPTKGTIKVLGTSPERARPRIGYMPQHANVDPLFPATAMDVVLMGRLKASTFAGPYGRVDRDAAREALNLVGLLDAARKPYSDLSGGQRQRVLIARALATEPELLLMDEPTAGLDAWAETHLYDLLQELNRTKTVIIVSHDIGMVSKKVDSVICVSCDAEIHPTSELTGEMINKLYGGDMKMVRHDHRCAEEGHKCSSS